MFRYSFKIFICEFKVGVWFCYRIFNSEIRVRFSFRILIVEFLIFVSRSIATKMAAI